MVRLITMSLLLFLLSPVQAQNGYPLPDNLTPITVENAAQVEELARIGSREQPGALAWSPDGAILAVGTSSGIDLYEARDFAKVPQHIPDTGLPIQLIWSPDGTKLIAANGTDALLYDPDNLEVPPIVIPDGWRGSFDAEGNFLFGGKRWDIATGQPLILEIEEPDYLSADQSLRATYTTENDEAIVHIFDTTDTARSALVTFHTGVSALPYSILFSPDNRVVVIGFDGVYDADGEFLETISPPIIQLWDIRNGALLAAEEYNAQYFPSIEFTSDGTLLVTIGNGDGEGSEVRLWDTHTGEMLGIWSIYSDVSYSPDRRLLAIEGREVKLWNGTELLILPLDGNEFRDPTFSPDGRILAAINRNEILIWGTNTLLELGDPRVAIPTSDSVYHLIFSPDSTTLAGIGHDNTVRLIDVATGIQRMLLQNVSEYSISFSADSTLLRALNYDGAGKLWDVVTGLEILTVPPDSAFNSDWSIVAYWMDGVVKVVDTSTAIVIDLPLIKGYLGYVATLSPSNEQAVFMSSGLISGYSLRTGAHEFSIQGENRDLITQLGPDGQYLYTYFFSSSTDDPRIQQLWDTSNAAQPLVTFEERYAIGDGLFSPDGKLFALRDMAWGYGAGTEQLWDVESGTLWEEWRIDSTGAHAFSPDGTLIAAGSSSTNALILRYIDSARFVYVDLPEFSIVDDLVFTPNGNRLGVSLTLHSAPEENYDMAVSAIYLLDVATILNTEQAVIDLSQSTIVELPYSNLLVFSPDESLVATRKHDEDIVSVRLSDAQTGAQLTLIEGHLNAVFSPDSALLATSGDDAISLWDRAPLVNNEQTPLAVLPAANPNIQQIAFNPDGTLLFVRDTSGVSVWGVPST